MFSDANCIRDDHAFFLSMCKGYVLRQIPQKLSQCSGWKIEFVSRVCYAHGATRLTLSCNWQTYICGVQVASLLSVFDCVSRLPQVGLHKMESSQKKIVFWTAFYNGSYEKGNHQKSPLQTTGV